MSGEIATITPKNLVPARKSVPSSLRFSEMTFNERLEMCKLMAGSTSIPKALQGNPANIYYVAERGDRIGLSMTESISCIYVVNGVTALWGDIPLALCRASEQWDSNAYDEWIEIGGVRMECDNAAIHAAYELKKSVIAWCKTKRKDALTSMLRSYSLADAVLQQLDKKDTWKTSTKRMLQRRARALNLTDNFGDVLFGLTTQEVAEDSANGPEHDLAIQSQPATKGQEIIQQPVVETMAPPIATSATMKLSVAPAASENVQTFAQGVTENAAPAGIADNQWLDLCIFWKESRKQSLAKACAEFELVSVDDVQAEDRIAFRECVQKHAKSTTKPKQA